MSETTQATPQPQDSEPNGDGATGRQRGRRVRKNSNVYSNVRDYGAVGDGVTDDTAAIQAAFDGAASPPLRPIDPRAVYNDVVRHFGTAEELYCLDCSGVLARGFITPPIVPESGAATLQGVRHHISEVEAVAAIADHSRRTGHLRFTKREVIVVTPLPGSLQA